MHKLPTILILICYLVSWSFSLGHTHLDRLLPSLKSQAEVVVKTDFFIVTASSCKNPHCNHSHAQAPPIEESPCSHHHQPSPRPDHDDCELCHHLAQSTTLPAMSAFILTETLSLDQVVQQHEIYARLIESACNPRGPPVCSLSA